MEPSPTCSSKPSTAVLLGKTQGPRAGWFLSTLEHHLRQAALCRSGSDGGGMNHVPDLCGGAQLSRQRSSTTNGNLGVSYTRESFDLKEFERFLARLDDPHRRLKTVVVAGTKGKGSTAAMIASIAQASGLKAGLYTSPHLCSIRERIRVDGEMISEEAFAALVSELMPHIEAAGMAGVRRYRTFFEILTAMALVHFQRVGGGPRGARSGLGGTPGRDQCRHAAGLGHHLDQSRPYGSARRHDPARSPARRPGSSSRTAWRWWRRSGRKPWR